MTTVRPLKHLARINERALPGTTDPDREIRYVDIGSVGRGRLAKQPERMRFADAPSRARRLVRDGDTIVSTVRTYLRAVWPVRGATDDLVVSTGFAVLTPTEVYPRYFSWWVLSDTFIEEVVARSVGVSYPAINASELGDLRVRVPDLAEQRAIADYLDTETGRIDALITKKRRMIELLEERRALVTLAGVSGELVRCSPTLGALIPWMTRIPRHWGSPKIGYVASLGSGHTPSRSMPEWWIPEECTIPWITTGEVARLRSDRVEFVHQTRERISQIGLANSAAVVHPAHTVFLCRTASAGYSGIMGTDMATSQDFATWTCGPRLEPRFLLLCLRAMRPDLLGRLAMGSTHQTIYMPDIRSLSIPLPPLEEQREIILAVWEQLESLGRTEDRIGKQLDLLKRRREALITAAVTGELSVA